MARKPSPAQLRARAAFAARFGGKRPKANKGRRKSPVAKRKSSRASSRRFSRGVSQNSLLNGAMAGAAANVGARYLGPWGAPVGLAAVGIFRKEPTLQLLAGISVGNTLGASIPLPGATGAMPSGGVL